VRVIATTVLLSIAYSAAGIAASAQTVETGFLNRAVRLEGVEYRYQVYVPREFRRSTKWPVILALHGGGEYGDDGIRQTEGGLARQFATIPNVSRPLSYSLRATQTTRRAGS
jgi:predicted peptidase